MTYNEETQRLVISNFGDIQKAIKKLELVGYEKISMNSNEYNFVFAIAVFDELCLHTHAKADLLSDSLIFTIKGFKIALKESFDFVKEKEERKNRRGVKL
jgi:hypothetical protein